MQFLIMPERRRDQAVELLTTQVPGLDFQVIGTSFSALPEDVAQIAFRLLPERNG